MSHGTTKSNESIALFELITVKLYIVKATNSTRNGWRTIEFILFQRKEEVGLVSNGNSLLSGSF